MDHILTQLPKVVEKRKKRLGRGAGSGKGAKSGRGTTRHQKAREKIPLAFEGGQNRLIKRFPLLRGKGRNKSVQVKPAVVAVAALNVFDDGAVVTLQSLRKKGLVNDSAAAVKILARGELTKKLQLKVATSETVRKMVEKKGGSVVVS